MTNGRMLSSSMNVVGSVMCHNITRDYQYVTASIVGRRCDREVSLAEITGVIKRRVARHCGASDSLASSIYVFLLHVLYQQQQPHHFHAQNDHYYSTDKRDESVRQSLRHQCKMCQATSFIYQFLLSKNAIRKTCS